MSKSILFFLTDPDLVELEWILPVMAEFKKASYHVMTLFAEPPHSTKSKIFIEIANELSDEVQSLDDFEVVPTSVLKKVRQLRNRRFPLSKTDSFYFGNAGRLLGVEKQRKRWLQHSLGKWLRRQSPMGIFLSHRKRSPQLSFQLWEFVLDVAQQQKIPIIGFPPAANVDFLKKNYLMPYDLTLVTSKAQADFLRPQAPNPVTAIGAPQLDPTWIEFLKNAYESKYPNHPAIPQDREIILVVLKNDTSVVWNTIDYVETTQSLIRQLIRKDRFLILKPHPRQTLPSLKKLLAEFSEEDYRIDFAPIAYWLYHADRCVSLFSGGSVHSLALGKVSYVYWPVSEVCQQRLERGEDQELYEYIQYHPESKSYSTQFDAFAVVTTAPQLDLKPMDATPFLKHFESYYQAKGSAERLRLICESHFSKK